jgi:hypothetical protein
MRIDPVLSSVCGIPNWGKDSASRASGGRRATAIVVGMLEKSKQRTNSQLTSQEGEVTHGGVGPLWTRSYKSRT